jgi:hypothetical protein
MEYLMTYGWAILIVIIVAAALFALGVFNPATYTGRAATGFGELGTPADWQYSGTSIQIVLRNQVGQEITITEVSSPSCSSDTTEKTMLAGSTATVSLTGCARKNPGDSYSEMVTVKYSVEAGMTRTASGTLTGTAV